MAVVRRLPEELANQIAAGEVVERPAAVVKELVENACDAGAKRTEVRLEEGGRRRIEVVDDGVGMSAEDALVALERHTTSKLQRVEDLFDIHTFGFRGEALPSIASVSRLTLTTRRAEDALATRIRVEGGRIAGTEQVGAPLGTRIDVEDLFFNVPARLSFLRTRQTEVGHAMDWLTRLALANRGVSFLVRDEQRTLLKTEATGDLRERVSAVLGRELHGAVYPVEHAHGDLRITGLCAGPQRANATTREIFTFVNGRYVRDRGLLSAIARAYEGVLLVGRSPTVVLFLEIAPGKVDVNVHPQKLEVRFSDARSVYDAMYRALVMVLSASPWVSSAAPKRSYVLGQSRPASATPTSAPVVMPVPENGSFSGDSRPPLFPAPQPVRPRADADDSADTEHRARLAEALARFGEKLGKRQDELLVAREPASQPALFEASRPERAPDAGGYAELRVLAQAHRTYVVCESPTGLVLVDQHAAHERVLYERYRAERAGIARTGQPLLVPISLDLAPAEARSLEAALEALADLGFEIEPFGGTTFAIKAAPQELRDADLPATVRSLASEFRLSGSVSSADALEESLLIRMACHNAVRAGDPLEPEEMRRLLSDLAATPFHAQCPHGRPIAARFEGKSLEAMFSRDYRSTPQAARAERRQSDS